MLKMLNIERIVHSKQQIYHRSYFCPEQVLIQLILMTSKLVTSMTIDGSIVKELYVGINTKVQQK